MSVDEKLLATIVETAAKVRLEIIFIGNAAAALNGAPVTTDDCDLFVRHTTTNIRKLRAFASALGGQLWQPYYPASRMMRMVSADMSVDFVFHLSSHRTFESVRSRASKIKIGSREVLVASLEDIIAAKEAANRPKDLATLPILKATLRTKNAMKKSKL
jgi:predicted nucleotidyltransferase